MRLALNTSVIQAISTGQGSKKPKFMKIMQKDQYYVYTSLGVKILAHGIDKGEMVEREDKIKQYSEGIMPKTFDLFKQS